MNNITLRPFRYETDLELLFRYMGNMKNQCLFSHKFQINTIQSFERWLTEKLNVFYHDFFMIENYQQKVIGFTCSYDFFVYDGHCKFMLCLFEDSTYKGAGPIAAAQMLEYLFSFYPLHQVFTTVFSYNANSLSTNLKGGFREVGVLPNYRFLNGQYHSLHFLVMDRTTFEEKKAAFPRLARYLTSEQLEG